ncbi:MAG TPA: DNA-directed DNA polymerase [Candidatus Bathyarchaeia archaeon]|nr:DNA-directed DNA polymerase [Candidatus Bathyarchaeia archaeon]
MNRKEEVRFLLTDLDYKFQEEDDLPVIRLFGKSNDTQVLVHVHGFTPYLYVKKNPDIEFILQNDPMINRWQKGSTDVTLRRYFWAGEQLKLVKLFGKDPAKIKDISRELEKLGLETFETDIPFLKRFLIDNDIKCLNVITVKATKVERKDEEIFAEADFKDIQTVDDSEIASPVLYYPLKIMSLNIKIARENESVQELWQKKNKPIISLALIWGTNAKPENGKLVLLEENSEDGEKRLLLEFIRILHEVQPDILCTYQGDSFDLPYLFHRMYTLKVPTHLLSLFKDDACFYSSQLLSYRIKGRMCFDLALRTWGIHPSSGKKGLYDISQETLGRGKPTTEAITTHAFEENPIEHGEVLADSQFWFLWKEWTVNGKKESLSELAKRCFYDSKLIYDLYWTLGMTGWIETLRVTGFPPAESNSCTERLNGEFELMRYMRRKGILIPKRPDKEQVEKNRLIRELYPHEGGTVLYPIGSLHTGVLIADFRSMYPSVMIAQNIGGETLKQWIQASDYGDPKRLFDKQSKSCLAIMEETLINKRIFKKNEIKRLTELLCNESDSEKQRAIKAAIAVLEREQNSMKIVANSMYGAHFYIRSRFYTQTLASAISDSARSYLLGIEEDLAEISKAIIPCELIYGDTDSAFIKISDESFFTEIFTESNLERKEKLIAKLMRMVNVIIKKLNNRLPNPLELKIEDIAYRIIFKPDRKKAYSYVSLLNDDFKVKGLEAVRSDWSPLSRSAQRKVLEILLRHPKNTSEKENEFQIAKRFLINLGAKVLQMPVEELVPKVVILTPIRRAPEVYKAKTPAVEAFRHYAKMEQLNSDKEWMDYDKFPWIITAGEGAIYNRARHPKYVDDIDREHYIREMLRCCEDLGVKVSLKEVQGALPTGRLHHLFEKANTGNAFIIEEVIDFSEQHKHINEPVIEATIIEPVKEGELGWRNKVKGIRRNVIRQKAADQTLLALFSEPSNEETPK